MLGKQILSVLLAGCVATMVMTFVPSSHGEAIVSPPVSYSETLATVKASRNQLLQEYNVAESDDQKSLVLRKAATEFIRLATKKVAPYWYGTPWSFNGTTQMPGTGTIACGYFVTTVLRDMGVNLHRVWLAQQASEVAIKKLVGPQAIRRYSDISYSGFLKDIREWGSGLYVVGLDCHIGFVVCEGNDIRFLHCSFVSPGCVVSEKASDATVLKGSRYRVLGKLTADNGFLLAWLRGTPVAEVVR